MRAHALRYKEYPVVPWKNGLGVTRAIMSVPPESEPFDWRLSMADITTDAAFSEFPGVDRQLAVVSGEIELSIEDAAQDLRTGDPAVSFSGEVRASARPLVEPAVDLNLMVARDGGVEARIEPLIAGRYVLENEVVIVAITQTRIRAGAQYMMFPLDSLFIAGPGAIDISGEPERVLAYGVYID